MGRDVRGRGPRGGPRGDGRGTADLGQGRRRVGRHGRRPAERTRLRGVGRGAVARRRGDGRLQRRVRPFAYRRVPRAVRGPADKREATEEVLVRFQKEEEGAAAEEEEEGAASDEEARDDASGARARGCRDAGDAPADRRSGAADLPEPRGVICCLFRGAPPRAKNRRARVAVGVVRTGRAPRADGGGVCDRLRETVQAKRRPRRVRRRIRPRSASLLDNVPQGVGHRAQRRGALAGGRVVRSARRRVGRNGGRAAGRVDIDGRRGRAPVPQRADLVGLRPRARAWTGGRGRGGRVDGSRVGPLRPRAGRRLLSIRSGDAPDDASGPARTDAIIVGRQRVNVSDRRGPARRVDRRARGTRDALSRILPPAARRGARPSKGHRRADRAGAAAAARHSSSSRRTGRRPRGQGLVSAESEPQQ
mmetsp:Transcript_32051/g.98958  ORF Transcript_32051/g.98958 Transcript_32051/m.98958 type:complete len:420 (+) Transcript_32051:930-2189(+)